MYKIERLNVNGKEILTTTHSSVLSVFESVVYDEKEGNPHTVSVINIITDDLQWIQFNNKDGADQFHKAEDFLKNLK